MDINLLNINGVSLPEPKDLEVDYVEKYKEYEAESGSKTIESIASDMLAGSVVYGGLLQTEAQRIKTACKIVSNIRIYNPATNTERVLVAKVSDIVMKKLFVYNGRSGWSLTFKFEELG